MTDIVLIIVLLAVIVYQGFINWLDRRDAKVREKDLLNRILSENFPEYVDGSQRLARKPEKPLTPKERIAGIKLAEKIDNADLDVLEVV